MNAGSSSERGIELRRRVRTLHIEALRAVVDFCCADIVKNAGGEQLFEVVVPRSVFVKVCEFGPCTSVDDLSLLLCRTGLSLGSLGPAWPGGRCCQPARRRRTDGIFALFR